MKILVIGATGSIGAAVVHVLEGRHEVLRASHTRSTLTVDWSFPAACESMPSLRVGFARCSSR